MVTRFSFQQTQPPRRMSRSVSIIAAVVAMSASAPFEANALTIFVSESQIYRYVNATAATTLTGTVPSDWGSNAFDDSSWGQGTAPFSSTNPSSTIFNSSNVNSPYTPGTAPILGPTFTQWDPNFDPYLRNHFTLAAPTALTIWIAVDNGINSIYLNGVLSTATFNAEGNAFRWEHVLDLPAAYTFAGDNVLALQLEDHGGLTGFSLVISADDAATNPPFTTNPPPVVPEPSSWMLFGLGLSSVFGLSAKRRQKPKAR